MSFTKFKAFQSADIAADFNRVPKELWQIGGWLNGLDVSINGSALDVTAGEFLQDGIIVVEDAGFTSGSFVGNGDAADPEVFYAMSNGNNPASAPTYAFARRSSVPSGAADIAESSDAGATWVKVQGVSIREILNRTDEILENHQTTVTAGEAITAGENVYIDPTLKTAFVADSSDAAKSEVVGVALQSVLSGSLLEIFVRGVYEGSFSAGKTHYLTSSGLFSDTAPASPNLAIPLGVAISDSQIIYDPDTSFIPSFVASNEFIFGTEVSWGSVNTVNIGSGSVVFDGRSYVFSGGVLTIGTDMDDGDVTDIERHSAWYYLFAKPNGSTYDALLSTAPPHQFRRSARLIGSNDDTFTITGASTDELHVQIDQSGSTKKCNLTAGTRTASEIVDDLNDAANWPSGKPAIRAYVVGGTTASDRRVAIAALGNVGSASAIKIVNTGNTAHVVLGFDVADDFPVDVNVFGQDWKFLGVVRNDANSDIFDFSHHRESGLILYVGQNTYPSINTGKTILINQVDFGGIETLVDGSNFLPIGTRRFTALVSVSNNSARFGQKEANDTTWDLRINSDDEGEYHLTCSDNQTFFVKSNDNVLMTIYGFYIEG